jgi:hypothetical protein
MVSIVLTGRSECIRWEVLVEGVWRRGGERSEHRGVCVDEGEAGCCRVGGDETSYWWTNMATVAGADGRCGV